MIRSVTKYANVLSTERTVKVRISGEQDEKEEGGGGGENTISFGELYSCVSGVAAAMFAPGKAV